MKNIFSVTALLFIFSPVVTSAAEVGNELSDFLETLIGFIGGVLIPFALAIAFIFFVWGVVKFFVIGGDNDEAKSKGKDMIIYSIVAFVVIFSFYGIVNLMVGGLGLSDADISDNIPLVPVN